MFQEGHEERLLTYYQHKVVKGQSINYAPVLLTAYQNI